MLSNSFVDGHLALLNFYVLTIIFL